MAKAKFASWMKRFNGAPLDLVDLAGSLKGVTDEPELTEAAKAFREAEAKFRSELERIGFEHG